MGEVTPFLCLFEIYGENSDSEKIFMASSSSWALYYEVFSWLKIQHSFANAPRTLPCLCSMWVFNKYYLMIRLNLGMTFYSCLWFTHLPGTHRCIWILFVKVKEPTWHLRKQSMHPLCVHSSYQWIYQQLLVISPFSEKPTEDPYRGLWLWWVPYRWLSAPTLPFCKYLTKMSVGEWKCKRVIMSPSQVLEK